jgi:DNA-binding NarL/FixJ family response regulator
MKQTPLILLVAQPGHLRDSLQVLLTALSGGRPVVLADSWLGETARTVNGHPDLVLLVLEPDSQNSEGMADIAQIKSIWHQTRVVALVDTEQQRQAVASTRADRVWLKGRLAAQMLVEIEELLNGSENSWEQEC